jgi:uncharacterized protein (TIGR02217 family)
MAFHDVQFPTDISWGATAGPSTLTIITELDSGGEQRQSRWSGARWRGDAKKGIQTVADVRAVLDFHRRRDGSAHAFPYKDWSDYATSPTGTTCWPEDVAVTKDDVQLGVGDGSKTQFQLVKKYTDAAVVKTRNITKPVNGTVKVALDGTLKTEGADYTVNYTTGIVTFNSAPGVGVVVTAGCEFNVPVRFGEGVDVNGLLMSIEDFDAASVPSIPLVEVIDGLENAEDFFFGGGAHFVLSANITLTLLDGRAISVDPQSSGLKIIVPDEATALTNLPAGGPYWFISNVSGSQSVAVHEGDAAGTLVTTIAAGAAKVIVLGFTSGGAKKWYAL